MAALIRCFQCWQRESYKFHTRKSFISFDIMLKRLNAYTYSQKFIAEGLKFLASGEIPERYAFPSKRDEFRAKYEGMQAKDTNLFHEALRIVPDHLIDDVLSGLYAEVGDCGRDRFFNFVTRKFVGITRARVQQFLNNQEVHQLTQPVIMNRVSKAIVMSKPMERWQIDLIDMSKYKSPQNLNTTFVLTVIDCFSKMAFVEPLKNKRADTVAAAMERIFKRAGAPKTIQSDNGGEFELEFDQMLERRGIEHSRSRSYNPQANGQIERWNGTLKRMIHSHMLRSDTKTYVPKLQGMVSTYNMLLHTTTGRSPNEVHENAELWPSVAKRLQSKAMKSKKRGRKVRRPPLDVGDTVRIALIHKPLKKAKTFWSRECYTVVAVIPASAKWDATTYELSDRRKFTRDRLQKVDMAKLVKIDSGKAPNPRQPQQKKVPVTADVVPRAQPQRERAPSSRLAHHFVDY